MSSGVHNNSVQYLTNHMANVTVYSTPTCGYCRMEKEWLDEKGISYTSVDISEDQEEAAKIVEKTGQMGVPVTIVEEGGKEDIIIGFDQGKLMELLKIT